MLEDDDDCVLRCTIHSVSLNTCQHFIRVNNLHVGKGRFIVDRETRISMTKRIPARIRRTLAYQSKSLKGYTAVFVDHALDALRLLNSDDLKIITHLLPAYRPGTDDFITVRHSLYMLDRLATHNEELGPHDAYFLFVLHSSLQRERYPIPPSLEARVLPAMPYVLDSVLLIPEQDDFIAADRHRLAATVVDFFAAIDHRATKSWKDKLGRFASVPQDSEKLCNGYLNFPWHKSPQSAVICAEAVSDYCPGPRDKADKNYIQMAQALEVARGTRSHWIQLNIEIDTPFSADDYDDINRIFELIRPFYLERAPRRLIPAQHGGGDVTVADGTEDLHARLKRIRPSDYGQQREAVEYFTQRFPRGTGPDRTDEEMGDGQGPHVKFREVYFI